MAPGLDRKPRELTDLEVLKESEAVEKDAQENANANARALKTLTTGLESLKTNDWKEQSSLPLKNDRDTDKWACACANVRVKEAVVASWAQVCSGYNP